MTHLLEASRLIGDNQGLTAVRAAVVELTFGPRKYRSHKLTRCEVIVIIQQSFAVRFGHLWEFDARVNGLISMILDSTKAQLNLLE